MKTWVAWLGCAALVAGLAGCPSPEKARPRPPPAPAPVVQRPAPELTDPDYVAPPLPRAKVLLRDVFGTVHPVSVEVAATADARTRGLMWREQLASGQGMLFLFPEEKVLSFWMRNTLIPLDMIFIGEGGKVVGISARATPRTLDARTVEKPSRYVLEVPGGWAEAHSVRTGAEVKFEELEGIRATQ